MLAGVAKSQGQRSGSLLLHQLLTPSYVALPRVVVPQHLVDRRSCTRTGEQSRFNDTM